MDKLESDYTLPRVKLSHGNTAVVDIDQPLGYNKKTKDGVKHAKDYVALARNVFDIDRTRSVKFRKYQLKQLQKMYEEQEEEMMTVLSKDLGKCKQESAVFEVDFLKNDVLNMLYNIESWVKPEARYKRFMNFFDKLQIYHDPYGVVLVIGAWNFPLRSCLSPIAGAIAAGNCVIIHPSDQASNTAQFLAKTLPKYLDSDCCQVFLGDKSKTVEILRERFDYIFYTGQYATAKIVHEAAAKHLTPTTLIMGGKNPVYLDDTCCIEKAARRILWGKCMNAGQTCAGVEYILCTKEVQDKFVKAAKQVLKEFYGENIEDSKDFGRIISERHYNRTVDLLKGQNIAYGGFTNDKTRFVHPTILTNVSPNDVIMQEDILAPILPILIISNLQEAVTFINARDKPLAMYIFSKKEKDIEHLLRFTSSGTVCVNDTLMQLGAESLPFGGVGNSGMGAYHGKLSFDTFVHNKGVLRKSINSLVERIEAAKYPPYNTFKMMYIKQAMVRRRRMSLKWIPYAIVFVFGFVLAVGVILLWDNYGEKIRELI